MMERRVNQYETIAMNMLHTRNNYFNDYQLARMRQYKELLETGYDPVGITVYFQYECMKFTEEDKLHYALLYEEPDVTL